MARNMNWALDPRRPKSSTAATSPAAAKAAKSRTNKKSEEK